MSDAFESFSPITREWFRTTFGEPTPPQAQGWQPIQRGEHTLILAPTGSGKTLAAFLWSIDELFRELDERPPTEDGRKKTENKKRRSSVNRPPSEGIHLLYVSPLKALNNDVERNLRVPLEGIRATATKNNVHLPHIRVAVRTGDTPAKTRADMLKHPPHILITTPESLYLMLTSQRASELFRTTRTVIVDEIHTLAGNKRGVHLALTLERLQHIAQQRVQRIGLSATIKPLDEVARFLGGQEVMEEGRPTTDENSVLRPPSSISRPVTIVDARYKKPLDLEIVTVVEDFRQPGGTDTVWPYVIPNVLNDIRQHTTTLVFTNNRRLAERTADRLNAQLEAEQTEEIEPGSPTALAPGGKMRDRGIFAIGAQGPIRAHHGSMSKEARHEMEQELKAGNLPALVGTSSLELGIDIGAIDLVVQLQSPKSVSQGLQRVGRSGHLVGQTSHGKIYATFREDLAEAAAIARGMLEGDVEPTHTPQNALDVLAQHIVACVAMQDWDVAELYRLVRGAYPYHTLSYNAFTSVLNMLTGKYFYEVPGARAVSALRAKIAWDKVHDRLSALPGSRLLAISNVGTIPDTGAYKVYLQDNKTKIGELDEEFVLETRPGDNFLLGSQVWRAMEIRDDRVIVADAAGATPRMPFWNGDLPWRPYPLGERIGKFRREVAKRIGADSKATIDWLEREYALDEKSARNLLDYIQAQLHVFGAISSDRTIIVETFQNAAGDPHLVIHSPFGGRVNGAWSVALTSLLTERMGVMPEVLTNDDGIIFRFPQTEGEPPADIVKQLTADEARERILRDLPESAVFGAHFRMNAGRALLLTRPRAGKRTPFWLQRLKAKDLLAFVRRYDDFPIVLETYRDVLSDVFDLPHLEQILNLIQVGEIEIVTHESVAPSPIAAGLMFNFVSTYLYEWDAPKAERRLQMLSVRRDALEDVLQGIDLSELLKPAAIQEVVARAQHKANGTQVRSAEELALILRELGDLTTEEILARSLIGGQEWLNDLEQARRVQSLAIFTAQGLQKRWIATELVPTYQNAFGLEQGSTLLEARTVAWRDILTRYLHAVGPVTRAQILNRYSFDEEWLDSELERMTTEREIVRGHFTTHQATEWIDTLLLEQIHRRTLSLLRGEVQPVSPYAYAEFLARWQHAHPATRWRSDDAVSDALTQLRGLALPGVSWERDILPSRIADYSGVDLDALVTNGEWVWTAEGNDPKRMRVRFFQRGEGAVFLSPTATQEELSNDAKNVLEFLQSEGASFATDIQNSTGLDSEKLANALAELALQGLVTNDHVEVLRNLLQYGAVIRANLRDLASAPQPLSSLETELDARRTGPRRISQTRYQEAKRRVAARIKIQTQLAASPWRGRWALVQRASIMGEPLSEQEKAEKLARVMLERYGVITREVLEREELENRDALYPIWQRMEWRGEVRRGIFVAGVTGIQYALPDAVEQLRAIGGTNDVPYVLNATDPANPFGGEGSDLKFARVPSTYVVLSRGQPVLIVQDSGEHITTAGEVDTATLRGALRAFFERPNAPRHTIVKEWNGVRVSGSSGEALLKELVFYRIPNGMERWRKP